MLVKILPRRHVRPPKGKETKSSMEKPQEKKQINYWMKV